MNKQLKFVKRPVGEADASTWSLEINPIPELCFPGPGHARLDE